MGNACSSATCPATNAPALLDDRAAHRCHCLSAVGHSIPLLSDEGSSHIRSPLVLPPSHSLPMATSDVVKSTSNNNSTSSAAGKRLSVVPTESLAMSASLLSPLPPPQGEDRRAVVGAPFLHMAEPLTVDIQLGGTLSKPLHQRTQPPPAASAIVQAPPAEAEVCVTQPTPASNTTVAFVSVDSAPHQTSAPFGAVAPQRCNAADAFCEDSDHDVEDDEEFDDMGNITRNLQTLGDVFQPFLVVERAPSTRGSGGNVNELCPSSGQLRRSTGCVEPATPRSRSIGSSCSRHSRVSFLTHAVILGDHQIEDEDDEDEEEEGCGGAGEVELLVAGSQQVVEGGNTRGGARRSSISIAPDASGNADNHGRMNIGNFSIPATPRDLLLSPRLSASQQQQRSPRISYSLPPGDEDSLFEEVGVSLCAENVLVPLSPGAAHRRNLAMKKRRSTTK